MATPSFNGANEFKIEVTAGSETYGGCAADVNGNCNTPVQILVDPESCQSGGDPEYKVFFGDTTGQLTISNLLLTSIEAPTASEEYVVDLGSAETITITQTDGTNTFTVTLTDACFALGKGMALTQVADNLFFSESVVFDILVDNSGV